jgi:hypothetical protein
MCQLCTENEHGNYEHCDDCGVLICFDADAGDDTLRPAYITNGADLLCDRCGRAADAVEADDAGAGFAAGDEPLIDFEGE